MRIGTRIMLAALVLCGLLASPISPRGQELSNSPSTVSQSYPRGLHYNEILPQLQKTFRGPIRLPSDILDDGRKYPVYPRILKVSADSYEVIFTGDKDEPCEGAHVCTYSTLTASDHPGTFDDLPQRVMLLNGIRGDFYKMSCGAYCGEATLEWREGRFYYTIGIKGGERKELIRAANSAIRIARRN